MNNERAGERVFENVDEALAERIISRSMENSREPERGAAGGVDVGINRIDKQRHRSALSPIFKIALPAVLILFALWLLVRRRQ